MGEMDRGMVSEATLTWMREGGRRCVVGLPKSELKKHAAELAEPTGWKIVRDGVAVRYAQAIPDDMLSTTGGSTVVDDSVAVNSVDKSAVGNKNDKSDLLLLCRSDERREKETAMLELFSARIEEALVKLQRRCEKASKPLLLEKIQRQVGRLLQRNQRAAKTFVIRLEATTAVPSGVRVEWSRDEAERKLKEQSHGCYALRTNVRDWSDEDVWKTYIQLTDVEAAFRVHKTELVIHPIHHQREDRAQAHIFVCFPAFVLWKLLEQRQSRTGLGNSPRTILEEISHIQSGDIMLPTTTGEKIRLRSIVSPEKTQQFILQRLGIVLPRRMRAPDHLVPQM